MLLYLGRSVTLGEPWRPGASFWVCKASSWATDENAVWRCSAVGVAVPVREQMARST